MIDATPVLVVTAHPHPPDVAGYEIISKPFDLDHLVATVQQHLEGPTRRPKMPFSATLNGDGIGDGKGANNPARVELILYVAKSPRCIQAINTIKGVVSRFPPDRVTLTIHDLASDPPRAWRIRSRTPRRWCAAYRVRGRSCSATSPIPTLSWSCCRTQELNAEGAGGTYAEGAGCLR